MARGRHKGLVIKGGMKHAGHKKGRKGGGKKRGRKRGRKH
jgi:hypothetical protein